MADNFKETAKKMSKSAELTKDADHHHISCYLAGYVVESYLKIIVDSVSSISQTPISFGHNLTNLNSGIQSALSASAFGPARLRPFIIDVSTQCPNIFRKWNPSHRYDVSCGWDSDLESGNFSREQLICLSVITNMEVSGII